MYHICIYPQKESSHTHLWEDLYTCRWKVAHITPFHFHQRGIFRSLFFCRIFNLPWATTMYSSCHAFNHCEGDERIRFWMKMQMARWIHATSVRWSINRYPVREAHQQRKGVPFCTRAERTLKILGRQQAAIKWSQQHSRFKDSGHFSNGPPKREKACTRGERMNPQAKERKRNIQNYENIKILDWSRESVEVACRDHFVTILRAPWMVPKKM